MEIRFLGSGNAFGSGGRFQTCIAVRAAGATILVDCGATSLVAMRRFGVDPAELDAVVVSHLHGDHFGGLPFLVLDAQFGGRTRPLTIAGPPTAEARVRQAMEVLFPGSSTVPRKFDLRFTELTDRQEWGFGRLAVTPYAVIHPSGATAFALRVRGDGRVFAYSGDTEWTPALLEAAHGADLFVCEAYTFDKRVKYHLDYQTLMAHRPALECRRLVVTHMSEDMLARVAELPVEAASDGLCVEV